MDSRERKQAEAFIELWDVVVRYRWPFALSAFAGCALVLAAGLFLPRKYQAEAVFERRTDMVLTEITTAGATRSFQDPRQSLVKEISSDVAIDAAIEAVADELIRSGREFTDFERDALRGQIRRGLTVSFDVASDPLDRVRVALVTPSALHSQLAVNALVAGYVERTATVMDNRLRESERFFSNEVERVRAQIESTEDRMLGFEVEHGDLIPENPGGVYAMMGELQKGLLEAQQNRDASTLRVQTLKEQLAQTPAQVPVVVRGRNPDLDRLTEKLTKLQDDRVRATVIQKMTAQHPDVQVMDRQIADLTAQLAQTPAEVVTQNSVGENPRYNELSLMLAAAEADAASYAQQVTTLTAQVKQADQQVAALYPVRTAYRGLEREAGQLQRQLHFWEDNLRRVRMSLSAEDGDRGVDLAFTKPAGVVRLPVSPNLAQVVMAALMAGSVAGALRVFIAYRTDQRFSDPEAMARAINVPLVGSVSSILSEPARRAAQIRSWLLGPTQGFAMAAVILALGGALYLELQRPELYDRLTGALRGRTSSAAAAPASAVPNPTTTTPAAMPAASDAATTQAAPE